MVNGYIIPFEVMGINNVVGVLNQVAISFVALEEFQFGFFSGRNIANDPGKVSTSVCLELAE
jgi:hypothetical protein